MDLTKDADEMLCVLYREYIERREQGMSKSSAKGFAHPELLQQALFPEWYLEDISDTLSELHKAGYIHLYVESSFRLEDAAIVYMEGRFGRNLDKILSYISVLRP